MNVTIDTDRFVNDYVMVSMESGYSKKAMDRFNRLTFHVRGKVRIYRRDGIDYLTRIMSNLGAKVTTKELDFVEISKAVKKQSSVEQFDACIVNAIIALMTI